LSNTHYFINNLIKPVWYQSLISSSIT